VVFVNAIIGIQKRGKVVRGRLHNKSILERITKLSILLEVNKEATYYLLVASGDNETREGRYHDF